jgi:hypothetical protein
MIDTYKKGKDIKAMIWGAIWLGGRSEVVIMERDPYVKKNGYTAASYIAVLEDQLPQWYEPGMVFVQDNAPIHKVKKIKDWLELHGVQTSDWPPYSPDLNPIEHVWSWMKQWINDRHPELLEMGACEDSYEALHEAIREAWQAVPQDFIDGLIRSMIRRVQAVLKANGWQTKY